MNAKTVLKYASEQGAKFVSTRFTDLPGSWQHLTFPIGELSEDSFEDGFGFDASSIRGWAAIHESDMLLIPDATRFGWTHFRPSPAVHRRERRRSYFATRLHVRSKGRGCAGRELS